MKWKQALALAGMIMAAIPGCRASVSANFVNAGDVTSAFRDSKIEITSEQVQFFTDVPKQQPSSLEVVTLEQPVNGRSMAKMRCRLRHACIPFYVAVRWANAKQQASAIEAWKLESHGIAHRSVIAPLVIRAGQPAMLLISGEQLRIEVQVLCLENGRAGSRIRVRSKDGKKIYRAEVIGPNSVRINM